MTAPFRVELAGIPGAGKTWLAAYLVAELGRAGLHVVEPSRSVGPDVGAARRLSRKAVLAATTALREPALTRALTRSVAASGQPGVPDLAARIVQWQVAQGALRHLPSDDPAITVRLVDEGLVQCLWSIGLRGDVEPTLSTLDLSDRWQAADLLVVVRVPPAVAAARLAARASRHSRSQELPPDEALAELEHGDRLLDRLVPWWAGHAAADRVIEVDGSVMTPGQARALATRVVACAHRTAHQPGPAADAPAVLHVCTRYQRGGSERRIRDVVAALPELRHHLVLGRDSDAALAREQTSAHRVSVMPSLVRHISPLDDVASVLRLWRVLRKGDYSVVVTHQSKAGALGRLAALAAGGTDVVHSLSMGSFGPGYGAVENAAFRRLERVLGQRTAAFCVVGSDLAQRFAAAGVPPDRLHVVRSGVPLPTEVVGRAEARRALHDDYGIPPDAPLLCYVGSLEPRKNVLLLAVVLYELSSRLPERPYLVVVGDGPQRGELESRVRSLGLERQAVFTGHLAETDRVRGAVRAADVMVLLSKTEGLPQVLVQAAAEGTPFVAFDVEGVREILALGARGTAVALGDLAGVVAAVRRHLASSGPAEHEPVADLSSWSPDAIRAAYRRVFHDVLGLRPTAASVLPRQLRRAGQGAGRTSATSALAGRRPAAGALSSASTSTARA